MLTYEPLVTGLEKSALERGSFHYASSFFLGILFLLLCWSFLFCVRFFLLTERKRERGES